MRPLIRVASFVAFLLALATAAAQAEPRLSGVVPVTLEATLSSSGYMSPGWLGDGTLLVTTHRFNGLYRAERGLPPEPLSLAEGVGFGWTASPDGTQLTLREVTFTDGQRRDRYFRLDRVKGEVTELPAEQVGLAGISRALPEQHLPLRLSIDAGESLRLHPTGPSKPDPASPGEVLAKGPGYFRPLLSPDGKSCLVHRNNGQIEVWDLEARKVSASITGDGGVWLPDGSGILLNRSTDDGFTIQSADIFLWQPSSGELANLTAEIGAVALRPAISPDGKRVAFDDPNTGTVYVAEFLR